MSTYFLYFKRTKTALFRALTLGLVIVLISTNTLVSAEKINILSSSQGSKEKEIGAQELKGVEVQFDYYGHKKERDILYQKV